MVISPIDCGRVPARPSPQAQRRPHEDGRKAEWELLISRDILISCGDHDSLAKDLDSCGRVRDVASDR